MGTALGGGGGDVFGMLGQLFQAQGQMAAMQQSAYNARAEAQAAEYNAQIARQNATLARQQAAEEERRQRVRGAKDLGRMRAAYGASGLTLEGSPMDVLEESAATAELDALTIRHRGELEAYGYEREAQLSEFRARNARSQASAISRQAGLVGLSGLVGLASSVLTGAGAMGGLSKLREAASPSALGNVALGLGGPLIGFPGIAGLASARGGGGVGFARGGGRFGGASISPVSAGYVRNFGFQLMSPATGFSSLTLLDSTPRLRRR